MLFAKDIVDRGYISLREGTNAFEAARIMRERKHGYVIVAAEDGNPIGIVTEWDYVSKIEPKEEIPERSSWKKL